MSIRHAAGAWICAMAVSFVSTVGFVGIAHAQRRSAPPPVADVFQDLVREAGEAYSAGQPERAISTLERAYALRPAPILLFNIGRAHELAGRYSTAIEFYDRFLASGPGEEQARAARNIRENARMLMSRRAGTPPPSETATPPAEEPRPTRETPHETPHEAPVATPPVAPAAPVIAPDVIDRRPRERELGTGSVLGIGVGACGLIAGVVLGVMTLGTLDQFASTDDTVMRAAIQDRGRMTALGADIAIGVGIVAIAVGLIGYVAQDTQPAPTHTRTARVQFRNGGIAW